MVNGQAAKEINKRVPAPLPPSIDEKHPSSPWYHDQGKSIETEKSADVQGIFELEAPVASCRWVHAVRHDPHLDSSKIIVVLCDGEIGTVLLLEYSGYPHLRAPRAKLKQALLTTHRYYL